MSLMKYNGITLPMSQSTRFQQEAVYDDVANVDWCGVRFDIQVQSVFNLTYLSIMSADYANLLQEGTHNAADIMKLIRSDLLRPRRQLSFTFNGRELIPARVNGNNGLVDTRNGPQPQSCVINQLNNETFIINYHIIATYWESYAGVGGAKNINTNLPGNIALYNRWTETVDIDNCMYSKRTRSGKYMIRSDNVEGFIADMNRSQLAVLSVPTGFVRESTQYTQDPSGLGISYTIVDKEVFKLPPKPAFEADGEFTWSTNTAGVKMWGEVRLRLKGCKDRSISPQNELVAVAARICSQKLSIVGAALLEGATVKIGMYENYVEMYMRAWLNITKERLLSVAGVTQKEDNNGFKTWMSQMCVTPFSEDGEAPSPPYQDRGTAGLLLQAAKYWDASLRDTVLGPGDVATFDASITQPGLSQHTNGLDIGAAGKTRES